MSEKRFRVRFEQEDGRGEIVNEKGVELTAREVVELLNEQQATINELKERNAHNFAKKMQLIKENEQLRQQLQEKQEDEKLYAQEILELNKTKKEMLNFRNLGSDY